MLNNILIKVFCSKKTQLEIKKSCENYIVRFETKKYSLRKLTIINEIRAKVGEDFDKFRSLSATFHENLGFSGSWRNVSDVSASIF